MRYRRRSMAATTDGVQLMPAAKRKTDRARKARRTVAVKDPTDPQREAVYAWESQWLGWELDTLTLNECRVVVRTACRLARVPYVPTIQHKGTSEYDCIRNRISLQRRSHRGRGGKNTAQVLHEVAHYVVFCRSGWRPQDHGPTFLGVFLRLLAAARVAPRVALEASARHTGLKWYPCSE